MPSIKIKVLNSSGHTMMASGAGDHVFLVYTAAYQEGDQICIESSETGVICEVRLEDTLLPATVYLSGTSTLYPIPCGERRLSYSPKSFSGSRHLITARVLTWDELHQRRNLSLNPYDQRNNTNLFPHASANFETSESIFEVRNVIDGIVANSSHGEYPYQSWDASQRDDAELRIDFGCTVYLDEIRMILRADFPHDNYWTEASFLFSDGSLETAALVHSPFAQSGKFEAKKVEWLVIKSLRKSKDPSPFLALSQFEAWGAYNID